MTEPTFTYTEFPMCPFLCPVCIGKGLVPNGFYMAVGTPGYATASVTPETCRTCQGQGIVWGGKHIIGEEKP